MHFLPRNTRDILRFKILMNIAWIAYQFTAPLFSGPLSRRTSSFLDDIACFFYVSAFSGCCPVGHQMKKVAHAREPGNVDILI